MNKQKNFLNMETGQESSFFFLIVFNNFKLLIIFVKLKYQNIRMTKSEMTSLLTFKLQCRMGNNTAQWELINIKMSF